MRQKIPFILGLVLATTVVGAERRVVKLDRPFKVGDTVSVSTEFKMNQSITSNGREKKSELSMKLEGTETVNSVSDSSHQPMKVTIKVARCTADGKELVPAGATIVADASKGKPVISVNGRDAEPAVAAQLIQVVSVSLRDERPDEQLMGTPEPKKAGDSWKMKTDPLAEDMNIGFAKVTPRDVTGEVALAAGDQVEGAETEKITGTFTVDIPKQLTASGTGFTDYKYTGTWVRQMPVDPGLPVVGTENTSALSFELKTDKGTAKFKMDVSKKTTYGIPKR